VGLQQTHGVSSSRHFHPWPATGSTHPRRFFFLLPTVGLHLSSSFSSFSFLSSYNQVVWFYFGNVFHAEVADDE
jgi:hypothetical protein